MTKDDVWGDKRERSLETFSCSVEEGHEHWITLCMKENGEALQLFFSLQ